MFPRHRLAEVAALLGDPGRAGMIGALMDGTARPAGELARIAGVTPPTASGHLAKLVAGGLLRVEPRGRQRRYRLAGPGVAHAVESLARLLPPRASRENGEAMPPLQRARLCYDHLAGRLGVELSDALVERCVLRLDGEAFAMLPRGRSWLERFGISLGPLEAGRRPLLRACLDWTERREHLGGALGAALASLFLERDWLRRERGTRALLVTREGRGELQRRLGLRLE